MSSAYSKQETNLPLRSRGSQSFPKLSAKSLIYKEKIVGIKIQPCFTPILDLKVSVRPSDKFTEKVTLLCIFSRIL
jgi:hypothetical protein